MKQAPSTALEYTQRGFVVVPIPHRGKSPDFDGWQDLRLDAETVEAEFTGRKNIGINLGPSGLVDIDLDCPEARKLAKHYLDQTATFGRESNRRSHWIYSCEDVRYRKFIDPVDRKCLLEIRAGDGKQTVFPGSTHESGEPIEWETWEAGITSTDPSDAAAQLAVAAWEAKHPGEELPERVQAWLDPVEQSEEGERVTKKAAAIPVFCDAPDEDLIELIVQGCPEGSRHDYRLAVSGAMYRAGVSESAARKMLVRAMRDERLGDDRTKAIRDAKAAVSDTYATTRNKTGAGSLIETFGGKEIVDRISVLVTPQVSELGDWIDELYKVAIGTSLEPLQNAKYINGLAQMLLKKDSRLPLVWATIKENGFGHLRELKDQAELRCKEIRKGMAPTDPVSARHPDAEGMQLPPGYLIEGGRLMLGEETIINGELELLAKCPSPDGVQCRIAFRPPSSREWRHSVVPYRSLVDQRSVLVLAEHGCNISSLESAAVVGYVRDFVVENEKALERPIATQTGWHSSGAYVWGRTVIDGPEDLRAEYPADNQIGLSFINSLDKHGKRSAQREAIAAAVTKLPTTALCVAASLAAAWTHKLKRPCIGVHLAGMGGQGKTRTLKIAGSVWGYTGGAGALAAQGVIAGANTTQRALEVAASVRNDLPLLVSDVRPFPGLVEVMHAVLNGDPRARATRTGGSTMGAHYTCGAVITEGELNVLSLTTRQGFHRRMLELAPDSKHKDLLWELGSVCSESYGHIGPAFVRLGEPDTDAMDQHQIDLQESLGFDGAANAATLIAIAEHASELLGVNADDWITMILRALKSDKNARNEDGETQSDRVGDDLSEILVSLAPQIAESQEQTRIVDGNRPWVGFREDGDTILQGSTLRDALTDRGHHAIKDAIQSLVQLGRLSRSTMQASISGYRVRCYRVADENAVTQ